MKKRILCLLMGALLLMTSTAMAEGLSLADKIAAKKVAYISEWEFFKYERENVYVIRFRLKDKNKEEITAPAEVSIRIEDESGKSILSKQYELKQDNFIEWTNWLGKKTMATICIEPEELPETETGKGTVYMTVKLSGFYEFDEVTYSTNELPKKDILKECELITEETPMEIKEDGYFGESYKVRIDEIKYEFEESWGDGEVWLKLYVTGEKTDSTKKEDEYCYIGWKLYDEEDYVVKSGRIITDKLKTGDKFRDLEEVIYSLKPGKYRLKIVADD